LAVIGEGADFLLEIRPLIDVKRKNCPPGARTGDPISPDEGYFSNALQRVTAVEIDPSGNLFTCCFLTESMWAKQIQLPNFAG